MKRKIQQLQPLSGFMELLPAEQILFNQMLDIVRRNYELFGFIPLSTPLIEKEEVLMAKGGIETDKQIYRIQKGKVDLALRFDLTVPLARYVAQHYADLQFPFRRYQIDKVFRGERAQKGRYREFYQCDIDIIGNETLSLANDAEIPGVIYATFRNLGLGAFTIRINNRKILNGFFQSQGLKKQVMEILRIIDKFEKIGKEQVKSNLLSFGLSIDQTEKILSFITIEGENDQIISQLCEFGVTNTLFIEGVDELKQVCQMVGLFGVPRECFKIDLAIARGLDYYTGTVYETTLNDCPEIGSICSGGRYDNLAEAFTDRKLPGVGISIGFTRLFSQLKDVGVIKAGNSTPARVMIIPMDNQVARAVEISAKFRANEISTFVYLEQKTVGKIFKIADRLKIPFALIIGNTEVEQGLVSLKDMASGVQDVFSAEEAIDKILSLEIRRETDDEKRRS